MMTEQCEQRIQRLHPRLQDLAQRHYDECLMRGVRFRVSQAFRSTADQLALWIKGRDIAGNVIRPKEVVTMARPGRSWHEYGLAYDVVVVRPSGELSWDTTVDFDLDGVSDWREVGLAGEKVGLEWGGRWKKFMDMPHFQFTRDLTYEVAAAMTAGGGIPEDYFA